MNKIKVALIYWQYAPVIGGVETYLEILAKKLIEQDHEVHIITSSIQGCKKFEKKDGVFIHRTPLLKVQKKVEFHKLGVELINYLQNLVKKYKFEILSVHNFYISNCPAHTLALNTVSLNTGIPLVLTMHLYCKEKIDEILLQNMLWSKVIGITNDMVQHGYEKGVQMEKLNTVNNGVNENFFRPGIDKSIFRQKNKLADSDFVIISPARLICPITGKDQLERKGLTTLLKSISLVSQMYDNVKLVILGGNAPKRMEPHFQKAVTKIKDLAQLYEIQNKVIITKADYSEMPSVYNGSELMILASPREPFGFVFIEAMACEIPVIGCSGGGVPEIIVNGESGYLSTPKDAVDLSKRIIWIIKDPKKAKEFGRKGREIVLSKFTLQKMVDKTLAVFDKSLSK